jgi:phage baseplate assembly protein W
MQPNLGINLRKHLFEQFTDEKRITVQNEILDTFNYWLPFVKIKKLDIDMSETDPIGKNKLSIFILFNIVQDPNTTESIQMVIEGE